MKHHKSNRTLGRDRDQRKALLRSLARALVLEEKIETSLAKAKELRPFVEKIITKAKKDSLSNYRTNVSILGEDAANKTKSELAKRFAKRDGGYTRITKLPQTRTDASKQAIIEFVE